MRHGAVRAPPWLVAAVLATVWLADAPRTPDLAAQVYRVDLFRSQGFAVWDDFWFAGHHLPGYSLVFPALGALIGARLLGVITAVASTVLFDLLATRHFGERARAGTIWFAAASSIDLLIGRLTFSLGVAFGLAALLAAQRRHPGVAAVLAAITALSSPVAGAFVALAGAAHLLGSQDVRSGRPLRSLDWTGAYLAAAALLPIVAVAVLFPEGGRQPFLLTDMLVVVVIAVALVALIPRRERVLRTGAALYALAAVGAFVIATPMGSNVNRLAVFAGPVLVCATAGDRRRGALLASAAILGCMWWSPLSQVAASAHDRSTAAGYYAPLLRFLARSPAPIGRIEVPSTRAHWEAVYLARHYPLARGWETQLDTKYASLFYGAGLTAPAYRGWLDHQGVRWVAVPDAPLGAAGRSEAALIRRGLPYLKPAWRTVHWTVYRVMSPTGMASGPATLTHLGPASFTLSVTRPGPVVVRVHYTPYWAPVQGSACVGPSSAGWTSVRVRRAGRVRVRARFDAGRVLDRDPACHASDQR